MAAQVAVTTSLADPEGDFDVNLRGTLHVLEAVRRQPAPPPIVFASTNKVYGNLADIRLARDGDAYLPEDPGLRARGIGEDRPLSFYTPYGCSKGAADQYVLDYARGYGIPACVLRMSCIYGPRQLGTEDQGWLAHFLYSVRAGPPDQHLRRRPAGARRALRRRRGRRLPRRLAPHRRGLRPGVQSRRRPGQRRHPAAGAAPRSARLTGRTPDLRFADWRPGDQRYFVADTTRARAGPRPRRAARLGARASPGSPPGSRPKRRALETGRASEGRARQPALDVRRAASISAAASRICRSNSATPAPRSSGDGHEVLLLDGHLMGQSDAELAAQVARLRARR